MTLHDRSLSCLGIATVLKDGGVKLLCYGHKPPLLIKLSGHMQAFSTCELNASTHA